jgi:hypothetical protein
MSFSTVVCQILVGEPRHRPWYSCANSHMAPRPRSQGARPNSRSTFAVPASKMSVIPMPASEISVTRASPNRTAVGVYGGGVYAGGHVHWVFFNYDPRRSYHDRSAHDNRLANDRNSLLDYDRGRRPFVRVPFTTVLDLQCTEMAADRPQVPDR